MAGRGRRAGVALACVAWLVLFVASSPLFTQYLMARLERAYPPAPPEACPRADAIVLLGGGMQPVWQTRRAPASTRAPTASGRWRGSTTRAVRRR